MNTNDLNKSHVRRISAKFFAMRRKASDALDNYFRAKTFRKQKKWANRMGKLGIRAQKEWDRVCTLQFHPF